ncbi:anthranilate synthase component I [Geosporobacter ferrireducens]|uniref:Anthranilate synthase component 1 n=1 Tax=Geosporobacter ferrireducens TaxID=1424294 RepID=A0A1D8GEB7_9FIRM|nr:anthranilate synthase component I [Geosporobacter ferrireducens]AOT69262.1 anthranilate synthase component I [Geosporobacter ferrireducens]MTI56944.1 anthranilate synthase component I [Geosporobacter ferrireducens]
MIYPEFEELKRIGSCAGIVPICLEMEGDTETPITLFKKLCSTKDSYLLESVEGGTKWGRYSYIGRKPFMKITCYGQEISIIRGKEHSFSIGQPLEFVKTYMNGIKMAPVENMPDFYGGAVGYIGYDVIRSYEQLGPINQDDLQIPDTCLLFTEEVIVYDHVKQKIKIILMLAVDENLEKRYQDGRKRLYEIKEEILQKTLSVSGEIEETLQAGNCQSTESKESFMEKVDKAKTYIKNGDIFQVVLSQRLQIDTKVNPFNAYRSLRSLNPSPYMYFFDFGDYHVVGSSPELLTKVKEGCIETCPIAGTRPRGRDRTEDEAYARELLKDEKELAEHLMLVDLARNDIGKVSAFGTVEVNQLMDIQRYSHVMHIVSNVIGRLKEEYNMYDGLVACMPAGTVSGAPKIRAMQVIDELETRKRGLYAGAVGYFGFNGNMDMCIAIRTILFKDNTAYIQAGAGIVADSDPEKEYEETLRKAEALLQTIYKAKEESN